MISICIFTWGFTRAISFLLLRLALWIDFNLYFYVRIHKLYPLFNTEALVVNWFQFVFLREDSQGYLPTDFGALSCELISICIFTWGFTSAFIAGLEIFPLWIDFNLYFYVRIHKKPINLNPCFFVVNWFQFVFLREDSQGWCWNSRHQLRCELISICIFTWGFTRRCKFKKVNTPLWIYFNLYFYVRIHKLICWCEMFEGVVNWFQFVFLREDSQVSHV